MNLLVPTKTTTPPTALSRALWAAGAVFLIAFGLFEMLKHQGSAIWLGILGALGPDVPVLIAMPMQQGKGVLTRLKQVGERLPRGLVVFYNLSHHWVFPVIAIVYFSVSASTQDEAAPGFTLGLMWLAHICVDRSFGLGPRTADGRQRHHSDS
jgi:hypothetical protein